MRKNIFIAIGISLIISNFAYGRTIPNILINPDNQHEHGMQITAENSMILHPHTKALHFKIECPYQIKEWVFKNAVLYVFQESSLICRTEIATSHKNNKITSSLSIAPNQINDCKLYINYQDKEYKIKSFFVN